MKKGTARLGLGTVQFGLDYGISNTEGRVLPADVEKILSVAKRAGIRLLDTAAAYGDSERVLGLCGGDDPHFRVITKTPRVTSDIITSEDGEAIRNSLLSSLEKLKRKSLYGLLVHNADDLLKVGGEYLIDALRDLRARRLVRKIGVSVYNEEQLVRVCEMFTPDLVQVPLNILDQRLFRSGILSVLKAKNVEIHARSVFLQGLLLMEPAELDSFFDPVSHHLVSYRRELAKAELSPLAAALQFVLNCREVDRVLVGVCAVRELAEIISAAEAAVPADFDFARWSLNNPDILNPSRWRLENAMA